MSTVGYSYQTIVGLSRKKFLVGASVRVERVIFWLTLHQKSCSPFSPKSSQKYIFGSHISVPENMSTSCKVTYFNASFPQEE